MKLSTNGINYQNLNEKIKSATDAQSLAEMYPGSKATQNQFDERGEKCDVVLLPCGCLVNFYERESVSVGKWYTGHYAGCVDLSSPTVFARCDKIHDEQPD